MSYYHPDKPFDLRQIGYDVCEVNTKYRGFKSDLLLFRSQKEDKDTYRLTFVAEGAAKTSVTPKDFV